MRRTYLTLSDEDREYLITLSKKRTIQAQIVDRAKILLYKSDGMTFSDIAEKLAVECLTSPQLMQYICLSICTLLEDENKQEVTDEILEKAYKFTTVNFSYADVVNTMGKGPNQRGQQRKMYETTDGKLLDMYGLIVESLAKNPPLIEISFETFYSRIIQLIKLSANEKNPDKAIVKEHLRKLQNLLEVKEEIYKAIEWKDGKVYVLDPLFLFYLRWGRKNG